MRSVNDKIIAGCEFSFLLRHPVTDRWVWGGKYSESSLGFRVSFGW